MRPLLPLAVLAFALPLASQVRAPSLSDPAVRYREAVARWDAGDYPAALGHLTELLAVPAPGRWLDSVALLTGERVQSRELTSDGTRPGFSPDGRYATWQSRVQQDGPPVTTTVVRVADGSVVRRFEQAQGAAIAPSGELIALLSTAGGSPLVIHDLVGGAAIPVTGLADWMPTSVVFGHTDADLYLVAHRGERAPSNTVLHLRREGAGYQVRGPLDTGAGYRGIVVPVPGGRHLLFTVARGIPAQLAGGLVGLRAATGFGVLDLTTGAVRQIAGRAPSFSADGSTLVYLTGSADAGAVVVEPMAGGTPVVVKEAAVPLATPALSPDGALVVFGMTPLHDSELFLVRRDGTEERRLTREIQHDLFPMFLSPTRILGITGEGRHRRSWLYDVTTLQRERLFHNNTVRTIAPEYEWIPSPNGQHLLVVAERDGNTVTLDRGVYLMDLAAPVGVAEIQARLTTMQREEQALRQRGAAAFAPIAAAVRAVTTQVDVPRIYQYQKTLFDFDSKHISRPGNARAIDYLLSEYARFGYAPERQTFAPVGALGGTSANVLAVLPGTEHPELVYVVSSHFDSRAEGPGADDNTSGTAALLEAARVLAQHPQPATIIFASFTGEESGLLGSREFVRQAQARGLRIVGALNNDMIGWANDGRLDNTIRYSNPGIRDIQHAAAMQFSRLITYDALYYKNTDAHAYYEVYGDIVGGIGSYPVLGNPHYHQPHDVLEVINHDLVAEVSRTTVATLMLLASSPSRLSGLTVRGTGAARQLEWTPSPERGITEYRVVAFGADGSERALGATRAPRFTLPALPAGTTLGVKAWNARGLGGWDWARLTLP